MSTVHDRNASGMDAGVQSVVITTVDMRVYPMFAFLFGYGMVQLYRQQTEAGTSEKAAQRILRRRNWHRVRHRGQRFSRPEPAPAANP